jgi:hypothetical protein
MTNTLTGTSIVLLKERCWQTAGTWKYSRGGKRKAAASLRSKCVAPFPASAAQYRSTALRTVSLQKAVSSCAFAFLGLVGKSLLRHSGAFISHLPFLRNGLIFIENITSTPFIHKLYTSYSQKRGV